MQRLLTTLALIGVNPETPDLTLLAAVVALACTVAAILFLPM